MLGVCYNTDEVLILPGSVSVCQVYVVALFLWLKSETAGGKDLKLVKESKKGALH